MDSKLFWGVQAPVNTQPHGAEGSPDPLPPRPQGFLLRAPDKQRAKAWCLLFQAVSAQIRLQRHQVCPEPGTPLVRLKPVLVSHLRHSLYWRQFHLLGSRRGFRSLNCSVISSTLFLPMFCHLTYKLGRNTRLGRCPLLSHWSHGSPFNSSAFSTSSQSPLLAETNINHHLLYISTELYVSIITLSPLHLIEHLCA